MIYGIGCDIAEVARFEKWVESGSLCERFFNEAEQWTGKAKARASWEHYAARFAAKEAFSKALGTGFSGLVLKDFWVVKDEAGKPSFAFAPSVQALLDARAGAGARVHLSLSHEKSFAIAYVVIESKDGASGASTGEISG
ncbi:MAG: holo-ACP synthase [Treponema sp.]|nr:holo-ACP synthase [Treponema sp.]